MGWSGGSTTESLQTAHRLQAQGVQHVTKFCVKVIQDKDPVIIINLFITYDLKEAFGVNCKCN